MVKTLRIFCALQLIMTLLAVLGCSGGPAKPPNFPKLYPCSVTVTQEEKPLEGATVRLVPKTGTFDWVIMGITNANGIAEIATHIQFKGAPLGEFKVLVTKNEQTPSIFDSKEPPEEGTPEYEVWRKGIEYEKRPNYALVNRDYGSEKTTPFEIKIENGKNAQSFEVGAPIRVKISGG